MSTSPGTITKNDLLQLQLAGTIDEVIIQLEKIITYCEINNNSAGYFAALYHKVTCKVKDFIKNKNFEDCIRMEHLDVTFANRYLDAFHSWLADKPTTDSWKITFNSVIQGKPLVLQHLLLGMNAHINLDLGISTALVMDGFSLDNIHNDFNTINSILASMIDNIEDCLIKINPLMRLLNLNIYKYDEMLVQFSISAARDGAWIFANELSRKKSTDYENCIHARDESIQQLGNSIANPRGFLLKFAVKIIRLFEKRSVANVINVLGS
jgi:hypothetical protein